VIERLYDSEINAGSQSVWDGEITAWIGARADTPGNACLSCRAFARSEFADVALWLDDEAPIPLSAARGTHSFHVRGHTHSQDARHGRDEANS
jgi:hypothetical protein